MSGAGKRVDGPACGRRAEAATWPPTTLARLQPRQPGHQPNSARGQVEGAAHLLPLLHSQRPITTTSQPCSLPSTQQSFRTTSKLRLLASSHDKVTSSTTQGSRQRPAWALRHLFASTPTTSTSSPRLAPFSTISSAAASQSSRRRQLISRARASRRLNQPAKTPKPAPQLASSTRTA